MANLKPHYRDRAYFLEIFSDKQLQVREGSASKFTSMIRERRQRNVRWPLYVRVCQHKQDASSLPEIAATQFLSVTALAPSISGAAIPRASAIPPAAMTGRATISAVQTRQSAQIVRRHSVVPFTTGCVSGLD